MAVLHSSEDVVRVLPSLQVLLWAAHVGQSNTLALSPACVSSLVSDAGPLRSFQPSTCQTPYTVTHIGHVGVELGNVAEEQRFTSGMCPHSLTVGVCAAGPFLSMLASSPAWWA